MAEIVPSNPVPPTSAPAPAEPVEEDLSSLSPFKVLQKNRGGIDLGAPPASVAPPAGQFILPPADLLEESMPERSEKAVPTPPPSLPPPPPTSSAPTNPVLTVPPVKPVLPAPPVPANTDRSKEKLVVPPQLDSAIPLGSNHPAHASRVGIIAALGLLLALAILAGAGYVLALSGTRVPLLYIMVTKLSPSGTEVSAKASSLVQALSSYKQTGESSLTLLADNNAPTLPNPDSTTPAPLSSLRTNLDQVQYDQKGSVIWSQLRLASNGGTDVPLLLRAPSTDAGANWLVVTPASSTTTVNKVGADLLKQTLLYAALRPPALADILAAAQKETGYHKTTLSGQNLAAYTYTFTTSKLLPDLPEGSQSSDLKGEIDYYWKSNAPAAVDLSGTLQYQGKSYQYHGSWKYSDLNNALADQSAFQALLASSEDQASGEDIASFIASLGIVSSTMPTSLPADQLSGFTAIVPSGTALTAVQDPLTLVPPLPIQPASDAAIARDSQRKKDLLDLQTALERYKTKQGSYPVSQGLEQTRSSTGLFNALVPTYLTKMPVDPLPDTYWYEYSSDGKTYFLRSVAENSSDNSAKVGKAYSYFEFTNK